MPNLNPNPRQLVYAAGRQSSLLSLRGLKLGHPLYQTQFYSWLPLINRPLNKPYLGSNLSILGRSSHAVQKSSRTSPSLLCILDLTFAPCFKVVGTPERLSPLKPLNHKRRGLSGPSVKLKNLLDKPIRYINKKAIGAGAFEIAFNALRLKG